MLAKTILKILQTMLQQSVNQKLPDVQAGFRNKRSNCQHNCSDMQWHHPYGRKWWPIFWPPDAKNWLIGKDWCWERLKAGREGDDRGCVGWMASLTQWTWIWASSGSWWWTGNPGVLQSMGSQKVGQYSMTEQQQQQDYTSWEAVILTFELTLVCYQSYLSGACFPGGSEVKASASNAGNLGSIPGLGRSLGEGNGNPLQYPCLENPMDRGVW